MTTSSGPQHGGSHSPKPQPRVNQMAPGRESGSAEFGAARVRRKRELRIATEQYRVASAVVRYSMRLAEFERRFHWQSY
jgi:hypothetical protein